MSHSHAGSYPQRDVSARFAHNAKDRSEVALNGNGTSHDSSYRHSPSLDSESDSEETTTTPDARSPAPCRIVVSGDEPVLTALDRTGPRVRFRSRVRISAGMGRRWRPSSGPSSNTSSISSSPSSSISAPLRTHYTGSNGWGTLGSRIKLAASHTAAMHPCPDDDNNDDIGKVTFSWNGDGNARRRWARPSWTYLDDDADEHTHLLTATARWSYVGGDLHDGHHDDGEWEEREGWWREQLLDAAFGKWPGRLLNRHWWWWHLEPILCCFCEPDEEE